MKVAVIFVLVCLPACYSAPASRAVDWPAVCAKIELFAKLVTQTVTSIKDIANEDNAAVGSDIGAVLDAAAVTAQAILAEAEAAGKDQTLTKAVGKALYIELKITLAGVEQDLQDELAQLSAKAADSIREQFYYADAVTDAIAEAINDLLE